MKTPTYHKPKPVIDETGLETNLGEIAKIICSEPPKAPCSLGLIMDHETEDPEIEFNILKEFTISAMRILFGAEATPMTLSETDVDLLNSYLKSVGYVMIIDKEDKGDSYHIKISFEPYRTAKPNPYDHLKKFMKGGAEYPLTPQPSVPTLNKEKGIL